MKGEEEAAFKKREDHVRLFFDRLKEFPGFHVYEGKLAGEGEKARQKGVDIQLAVHMLTAASRGTVQNIALVAGDADFEPLADAVVAAGAYLTLVADRRSVSRRLIHAVDVFYPIDVRDVFSSLPTKFRETHTLPSLSGEQGINNDRLPRIRTGKLARGGIAELYSDGMRAILIYPEGAHQMHIRWDRPEAVVAFAEDIGEKIVWDS